MKGIDLNTYVFDYDLTFVVLLMHPNGKIYHHYGGRHADDAMSNMSMKSLVAVMKKTLAEHKIYQKNPIPPKKKPVIHVEHLEPMKKILKKRNVKCIHCHTVNDVLREDAQNKKKWSIKDIWLWPHPRQIGLHLDRDDQTKVTKVEYSSEAYKAGLRKGDRLLMVGDKTALTISDVQYQLEKTPYNGGKIKVEYRRGSRTKKGTIRLKKGWRKGTDYEFSWRPSMWGLRPGPGFGGKQLTPNELRKHRLPSKSFAFKVGYLVTWGKNRRYGVNAQRAGIRKGDIVYSIGGKRNFKTVMHFHAWFRLTRKPGSKVQVRLLRRGKSHTVNLTVLGH